MAKKYLLYIHDERFDNETEKSKLVNDLLDRHYAATTLLEDPYVSHTVQTSKGTHRYYDTGPVSTVPARLAAVQVTGDAPMEFCKHDAVKGFCKKGCR